MRRRSAKKSRHGCKECKRRHVKCDESKPSCANCKVRHSPCSFSSHSPIPPRSFSTSAPAAPSPISSITSGSSKSDGTVQIQHSAVSTPHSNHDTLQPATPPSYRGGTLASNPLLLAGPTFKLHHLELLHNFRIGVLGGTFVDQATVEGFMGMAVREAVQHPYLMDQILAISAVNMSTKRPHQRQFYQDEASHLQTRGLSLFNTVRSSQEAEDDLAGFVFSTLLSQQVLFDAFSTRADFSTFLDRFVTALHICGGVRVMCGKSWPFIRAQYQQQTGIDMPGEYTNPSGIRTIFTMELARLETFLATASLDASILPPCLAALGFLQDLSYARCRPRNLASPTTRVLQWAVVVPATFIDLIEQRRPEALVITAYYALLIHQTRDHWLSGDAGAFIIRSITRFLGKYWADWLAWPNEVLDSADWTNGSGLFCPIDAAMRDKIDELQ